MHIYLLFEQKYAIENWLVVACDNVVFVGSTGRMCPADSRRAVCEFPLHKRLTWKSWHFSKHCLLYSERSSVNWLRFLESRRQCRKRTIPLLYLLFTAYNRARARVLLLNRYVTGISLTLIVTKYLLSATFWRVSNGKLSSQLEQLPWH